MASSRLSFRYVRRFTTFTGESKTTVAFPVSVSKAKSTLRKQHDPDKALEIYTNVSNHSSSSRYAAQELTVRRLAKCSRFFDIETLLESQKNDPRIKDESFYSTLIRSYGRASMFDHAIRSFEEMGQYNTPRSSISFNALLTACLHCKKFDQVHQLFDEIPQRYNEIVPDKVSYGILIKSYCDSGSVEKGVEIMRMMEGKGVEVSTIAFTTVLGGLYRKGDVEVAEKLWDEMVKEKGVELDNAVYNVRLMGVQKVSPERVNELIDEMISVGLKPDTISYNYLMTAYLEKGMLSEAKKVYKGLKGNRCAPNVATFTTLIAHLCRNGLYEQGYAVFKKSVGVNKIPDFNTLKNLVVGLVKKKKSYDAKALIKTGKKKLPPSFLNEWKKLEEELGLCSDAKTNAASSAV